MQCCVSAGILNIHVRTIKQEVLQMLHQSLSTSLQSKITQWKLYNQLARAKGNPVRTNSEIFPQKMIWPLKPILI